MKWNLLILVLCIVKLSHAQWVEVYNFPDNGFSNIFFFNESEGIVLQNDKIYKSYNGGESWSLVEAFPSDYFFWHMDFYGDTGIIVGTMSDNQGLYTVDRGEHWIGLIPSDITYHNIDLLNGHEYYKTPLSDPHLVYCNIEDGICDDTLIAPGILLMNDIEIIDSDTFYVCASTVGPGPGLYKTINAGIDWQPIDVDVLAYLDFPTSQVGYGFALNYVIKSINSGGDWNQVAVADSIAALAYPFFLTNETGFIAYKSISNNSGIVKTSDGLSTWDLTPFPSEEVEFNSDGINSLFCLDDMNCWCITNYGKVFKTTNGGVGGVEVITTINEDLNYTSLTISPNPAQEAIIVSGNSFGNLHLSIRLCNIAGQSIYELEGVLFITDENSIQLNVKDIAPGIYLLFVETERFSRSFKVLIV